MSAIVNAQSARAAMARAAPLSSCSQELSANLLHFGSIAAHGDSGTLGRLLGKPPGNCQRPPSYGVYIGVTYDTIVAASSTT